MARDFIAAMKHRRSYYALKSKSPVSDEKIIEILDQALMYVPSALNSQSTRMVLLLGENHKRLWNLTKETLRKIVPADAFQKTEEKIDRSFASGYGTVLFFEDIAVVEQLQAEYPTYAQNFPNWSEQTSGMHQFAVWTMLEDVGFGVSLQHYNPLIDEAVTKEWNINPKWRLIGEMPFGIPAEKPAGKTFRPLTERLLVFK